MKIAVIGLGKMGHQIATKLHVSGHQVYGVVRRQEQADELALEGLTVTTSMSDVMPFFDGDQAVIWLMIPADAVDAEIDSWLKVLPAGSILIDGGNSDYRKTKERADRIEAKSIHFLDIGTSGGVHGITTGFSMMIGGSAPAYTIVEPIVEELAKPSGAYQYFGESGTGHYVKMVHNAIEYGMMQSLAEGYRMLEEGAFPGKINLADAGEVWQHGSVVTSWLNELTRQTVKENPTLEGIEGYVAESGEARWTLETAHELGIPLPAIQTAFDVRIKSQQGETNFATKLLAAMRNKFGGHTINKL